MELQTFLQTNSMIIQTFFCVFRLFNLFGAPKYKLMMYFCTVAEKSTKKIDETIIIIIKNLSKHEKVIFDGFCSPCFRKLRK